jgi:hypothetical protein
VRRSLPRTSVQFSNGRLVATIKQWRSYPVAMMSNTPSYRQPSKPTTIMTRPETAATAATAVEMW